MQIIDIKGKKWAVGLDWEILSGESTIKQESKEIAEKNSANFGITVDYEGTFGIGLVKATSKVPVASYYLALANQEFRGNQEASNENLDWIVIEETGDDKYWMAVIKSGIPAPQYDAILDITTIKDKIVELLIADTYTLFSTATEIISLFDGLKEVENKNINDLTSDLKVKQKFEKLRGIPNSVIYGGIAFVSLGFLVWGVASLVEGHDLSEKARKIKEYQQAEQVKKENDYKVAMVTYDKAVKENKETAFNEVYDGLRGNPVKILATFYNTVGNTNFGSHGWTLKTVDCVNTIIPTKDFSCTYSYDRTVMGTNRMLLEDFPEAVISGNNAIVKHKIEDNGNIGLDELGVKSLNELKGVNSWNSNMISQLQLLKLAAIEHKIEPSTAISFTIPGKPISPAELAAGAQQKGPETIQLGISKGELSIQGKDFELMKEFADNVDFYGVSLRRVKFDIKNLGEVSWDAYFNYYIKNVDGVSLVSSNSSGVSNSVLPSATKDANQGVMVNGLNSSAGVVNK